MNKLREKIDDKIKRALSLATKKDTDLAVLKVALTDAIMALVKPKDLVWHECDEAEPGTLFSGPYEITPTGRKLFIHEIENGDIKKMPEFVNFAPTKSQNPAKIYAQEHYNRMWLDMMEGE